MASQTLITCFSDLRGSTAANEQLGNEGFLPSLAEHLIAGKSFAQKVGGNYIKNIGDAHLVTFDDPEKALQFGMLLQQYCAEQPCLSRLPLEVKIGLGLGIGSTNVGGAENDIFGVGVNEAQRVQSLAQPGQILINAPLKAAIQDVWGPAKLAKFVSSIGEVELKGIVDPPKQELYEFLWKDYLIANAGMGLADFVMAHLNSAHVEMFEVTTRDLAHPGTVIWPVVPRDAVTAIHQGQAEIIRLLSMLGWRINLLIADCGALRSYDKGYSNTFRLKLEQHLSARGVVSVQTNYMSDLYKPDYPEYDKLQSLFKEISSKLTLAELLAINKKTYEKTVKDEIEKAPTLDCLRPALTLAAVLYFAEQSNHKALVVSGYDERIQWELAYIHPNSRNQFGVVMNPVLNVDRENQERQRGHWPTWHSQNHLREDMNTRNIAWWTFHLHAFLPIFPADAVHLGSEYVMPREWLKENQFDVPEKVQKDELAATVWKLLSLTS